jgi:hypothetical protein
MDHFYRTFLLASIAIAVATGVAYITTISEARYDSDVEVESPQERLEWEWMLLRDPATGHIPDGIRRRELAFAARLPDRDAARMKPGAEGEHLSYEWKARGPYNVGGRTRALAVDVDDNKALFAGGATGGMWRSTDGGESWGRMTGTDQHPTVTCITQDTRPGKTKTWYYGTGEYYGSGSSGPARYTGAGIFKSIDGGATWQQMPSTIQGAPSMVDASFDFIWNIAIDRSREDQDILYAAAYGGIRRSSDGGVTWSDVLGNFSTPAYFTDVAVTATGVVYATLGGVSSTSSSTLGIWRSVDGISWTKITPPAWPMTSRRIVIGISSDPQESVYFLGDTPSGGASSGFNDYHSFWKYTYVNGNGTGSGGLWENRSSNLPRGISRYYAYRSQSSYDMAIAVKPNDPDVVFIGGTSVYRSNDGFATPVNVTKIGGYNDTTIFMDYSYDNHHPDQHAIVFDPTNPDILYSGNDGGVFKTLDDMAQSVEWIPLNHGYRTTQFYALAIDHGTPGDQTIIGGMQDNSTYMTRSDNPTEIWVQIGPGDGGYCAIADGGTAHYVSSQGGAIYRIGYDDASNFNGYTRMDPGTGGLFINPFTLDPSNSSLMYHGGGTSLWRNASPEAFPLDSSQSTKTNNWTKINASTTTGTISAIGVSTTAPSHRVYCGTALGNIYRVDNADIDGAQSFWSSTSSTGISNGYTSCIAVDPENGDQAIAVYSNYGVQSLHLTTDGGESWRPIGGNLEEFPDGSGDGPSCRWATILHTKVGPLYLVGTSTGLYSTTELRGMETEWMQEGGSTIGNVIVSMIDARQSDGFVAVATHGNGVYSAQVTVVTDPSSVAGSSLSRSTLALHPHFPDPVRSATTLRFTLPATGYTRLTVYDPSGREVARLVDGVLGSGDHQIVFNPAHLASGIYHYRLESGGQTANRSMRLLR